MKQLKIFGKDFIQMNKENCEIICNDKNYELCEEFDIKDYLPKDNILEIELAGINNATSLESMFYMCKATLSFSDISKWDMTKVTSMFKLFFGCNSESLPDISNFNTINVSLMNNMLYDCKSLLSFPDISKWNTSNAIHMNAIC